MNGGALVLMIAGFAGFGAGAWIAATDDRTLGIGLMAMGLIFQVLTLRQLKMARKKDASNAGG